MKLIQQFRYYGKNDANNYPSKDLNGILTAGTLFKNYSKISHLGIQGVPGTRFYLNYSIYPIEIGLTGIYELDLGESGLIHAIKFDSTTLNTYDDNNNKLLIDIVYEGGV